MVYQPLDELEEELQTVASLVHLSIKSQQQSGTEEDASGAFDCSGDAERRFQARKLCLFYFLVSHSCREPVPSGWV